MKMEEGLKERMPDTENPGPLTFKLAEAAPLSNTSSCLSMLLYKS